MAFLIVTNADCVGFRCLEMEVAGLLHQKAELSAERIHPLDVFRVVDEERREERGNCGLDDGQRGANADVVCVIAEHVVRVKSREMAADDASLKRSRNDELFSHLKGLTTHPIPRLNVILLDSDPIHQVLEDDGDLLRPQTFLRCSIAETKARQTRCDHLKRDVVLRWCCQLWNDFVELSDWAGPAVN